MLAVLVATQGARAQGVQHAQSAQNVQGVQPSSWQSRYGQASGANRARARITSARSWYPGRWNPVWPRANWVDYSITVVASAVLWYEYTYVVTHNPPRNFQGGILFDDAVRSALVFRDRDARLAIGRAGDIVVDALILYPLLVDPAIAIIRGHPGLAWDLFVQAALVNALNGAIQIGIRNPVARERPSYTWCERTGENCDSGFVQNQSFPGGHASTAAAASALICTQHLNIGLYGGGAADISTCGVSAAAATFVALTRIMADHHWATDTLAGITIGVLVGWGVPTLLHYGQRLPPAQVAGASAGREHASARTRSRARAFVGIAPVVDSGRQGVAFVGLF